MADLKGRIPEITYLGMVGVSGIPFLLITILAIGGWGMESDDIQVFAMSLGIFGGMAFLMFAVGLLVAAVAALIVSPKRVRLRIQTWFVLAGLSLVASVSDGPYLNVLGAVGFLVALTLSVRWLMAEKRSLSRT
ncbi:MAG: hypothetical protein JRE71_20460 [Deltaproteobacteria bacterium]|nr:hypothetical protein [Deltaproteobacteria bacterium]